MDGWGYSPIKKGNAVWEAKTPNFDFLWKNYSHTLLNAFGENVGLPWGNIGSSEVGHTSIGSGKLVFQELLKVDNELNAGGFDRNENIKKYIDNCKKNKKPIHLIGLVSNGGVHSHINHLSAILDTFKKLRVESEIFIHMITDGRDTSPQSAGQFVEDLTKKMKSSGLNISISTIGGRYYAMDRDNRWERTKKYYDVITQGNGSKATSAKEAIELQYKEDHTDEFIIPYTLGKSGQTNSFLSRFFGRKNHVFQSDGLVHEGDNVFFFNIRPDRMRQILEMFLFPKKEIGTEPIKDANILTMITYSEFYPVSVAFPSEVIKNPLAKILAEAGLAQGHFAETEKYAHVTYFFNGGNATPFPNEVWELVHSPHVATYDLQPEMSANELTDRVLEITDQKQLDFVLINYANCDMVGHTGVYDKVIQAVETVDAQLKRLAESFPEAHILITADHGNAECMIHPETGEIDKKHTVNPVPFVIVHNDFKIEPKENEILQPAGILADIAPTILEILKLEKNRK
jgi:2,3-bisphosphoglycerate-independent phosphoglycerate mutase